MQVEYHVLNNITYILGIILVSKDSVCICFSHMHECKPGIKMKNITNESGLTVQPFVQENFLSQISSTSKHEKHLLYDVKGGSV